MACSRRLRPTRGTASVGSERQRRMRRNSRLANRVIALSRLAAFFVLLSGLAPREGALALPLAVAVTLVLIWIQALAHELGHAMCAMLCGGRLRLLAVRPVLLRFSPLRGEWVGWTRHRTWLPGGGRSEYVFKRRHGRCWGLVTVAGAAASLLLAGMLTVLMPHLAPAALGTSLGLAMLCVGDAVATLIPYRGSDGGELAKLRRSPVRARRERSLAGFRPLA